jgi:hypothetical protein
VQLVLRDQLVLPVRQVLQAQWLDLLVRKDYLDLLVRKVLLVQLVRLVHKELELQFLVLTHLWLHYKLLSQQVL